jgi:hypothetical protein
MDRVEMRILALVGWSNVRIITTGGARVPWQCKSAKGKLILTNLLTGVIKERETG